MGIDVGGEWKWMSVAVSVWMLLYIGASVWVCWSMCEDSVFDTFRIRHYCHTHLYEEMRYDSILREKRVASYTEIYCFVFLILSLKISFEDR